MTTPDGGDPTPILALLRDASDQRGWVRGLTFGELVTRSGRPREQVASSMRYFRQQGSIKFNEQRAGDPDTITALRVNKDIRKIPTETAARMEERALAASTPLAQHVAKKAEPAKPAAQLDRAMQPDVPNPFVPGEVEAWLRANPEATANTDPLLADPDLIIQTDVNLSEVARVRQRLAAFDDLTTRLFNPDPRGATFPALIELMEREADIMEAAATFERHGMNDLAEQALNRLQAQTPLERDVLHLIGVLRTMQAEVA